MAAAPDIAAPFGEDVRLPAADDTSEGYEIAWPTYAHNGRAPAVPAG